MQNRLESFWDKDVQLYYDVCVAVGLIGGQFLQDSLLEMRSIRRYCKLPFPDKPMNYYLHRYAEYIRKRMKKNNFIHPDCISLALSSHGRILTETLIDAKKIITSVIQRDFDRDPMLFYKSLKKSIEAPHGEYLTKRSLSAISKMQTFKLKGTDAGFALTTKRGSSELEVAYLFNQSGIPGLGAKLMTAAIELGPKTLDCFGPYLNDYYTSYGFEVIKETENVKMRNGTFQTIYYMKSNRKLHVKNIKPIRLLDIPKDQRTFELCYKAVEIDKMQLKYVPEKHKTEELIKTIRHYNGILKFTPFVLKTYENCLDAVTRNPINIKHVPRKYKTTELCSKSLEWGHVEVSLKHIPKVIMEKISYCSAVSINPYIFLYIPDELKTEEICWAAIKYSKYLFRYIPQNLITKELWMYAIDNYDENINYLPRCIIKEFNLLHSCVRNGEIVPNRFEPLYPEIPEKN